MNLVILLLVHVVYLKCWECGSQNSRERGAGGECEALTADESGSQTDNECGVPATVAELLFVNVALQFRTSCACNFFA